MMTTLWVLWAFYAICFVANYLYAQPYKRLKAARAANEFEEGAFSYALAWGLPIFTIVLLMRTFVLDIYHIPSSSMEPTLKEGDKIWVNRLAYGIRSPISGIAMLGQKAPAPGDVVVFRYPREPRTVYVKRVIGIPGDHIVIQGDKLLVNDELIIDPRDAPTWTSDNSIRAVTLGKATYYINDDPLISAGTEIDLVVPPSHYFTLGDNINHSEDSRMWGLVGEQHLIGSVNL